MRIWRFVIALPVLFLAACGVDGAPERPEPREQRAGASITLSGESEVGVVGGS